jgi:signal transduction histidine kinase
LPIDTEQALYRIGQEALHNVVKHANAETTRIVLKSLGKEVELAIEDDGDGFDPALVSGTKLGLIAMRQRAERLGGRLDVHSREGRGTRVTVQLPCDPTGLPRDGADVVEPAETVASAK